MLRSPRAPGSAAALLHPLRFMLLRGTQPPHTAPAALAAQAASSRLEQQGQATEQRWKEVQAGLGGLQGKLESLEGGLTQAAAGEQWKEVQAGLTGLQARLAALEGGLGKAGAAAAAAGGVQVKGQAAWGRLGVVRGARLQAVGFGGSLASCERGACQRAKLWAATIALAGALHLTTRGLVFDPAWGRAAY